LEYLLFKKHIFGVFSVFEGKLIPYPKREFLSDDDDDKADTGASKVGDKVRSTVSKGSSQTFVSNNQTGVITQVFVSNALPFTLLDGTCTLYINN